MVKLKKISGNPYLNKKEGALLIDNVLLNEILKNYPTPFIIFLENRVRNNINTFLQVFKSIFNNFQCFYSFKANFLPEICNIVQSEGLGAELIGLPELKLALKLHFPPGKIIVGGPYLPQELIEKCVQEKIKEIVVYDMNDLIRIDSIAKKSQIIQNICLRINTQKYGSKLGILLSQSNVIKLKKIKNECKNLKITTLLSHYSTQMNNIKLFEKNINILLDNTKILSDAGIKIENINLGGGFPEAVIMSENQLREVATKINSLISNFEINFKNIYFEPGRYLVGDAGLLIAKIIKVTDDRWIFLNIGNHICPKFAKSSMRFYNATRIEEPHKFKTSIAGIMPTDQDVLAKDYFFTNDLKEGDTVIITNVGAYNLTFSNRFPYLLPNIILVKNRTATNIFNPSVNRDFSIN
ncbi:MAG: alanine racemase [Candidatus Lokiarchaeota archaeon]|nr:alanine racemase [Candidatus Lokiarchaeota archaeon]